MSQYNIIAESAEYTVVSEYEHAVSTSEAYQSEAELERSSSDSLGSRAMSICRSIRRRTSYPISAQVWRS